MKITNSSKKIEQIYGDKPHKSKLPVEVIKSAWSKIAFIASAYTEDDLRNWKGLKYEHLSGDKKGLQSIRLNNQWRLVFKLTESDDSYEVELLDIEDYH